MDQPGVKQSKSANARVSVNPLSGPDTRTDAVIGGNNPPPIKWKPGMKSKFKPRGDDGREIRDDEKVEIPTIPPPPLKVVKKSVKEPKKLPIKAAKALKHPLIEKTEEPEPPENLGELPPMEESPQDWQKQPEWAGKDVSILFPCQKFTNPATAMVVGAVGLDIGREKVRIDYAFGGSMIYKQRNRLAHDFLNSGVEWSLWLDDDMIPPIGRAQWFKRIGFLPKHFPDSIAGRHFVHRLMEQGAQGKKIIGGMYFGRKPDGPPIMGDGALVEEAYRGALQFKDVVMAVDWVGTGCLLVHRSVYLDIQKKFPELVPSSEYKYWNYFLPLPGKGEDKAFCLRAKQCGIQAYVDIGCPCLHVGSMAFYAHNVKPGEQD